MYVLSVVCSVYNQFDQLPKKTFISDNIKYLKPNLAIF